METGLVLFRPEMVIFNMRHFEKMFNIVFNISINLGIITSPADVTENFHFFIFIFFAYMVRV